MALFSSTLMIMDGNYLRDDGEERQLPSILQFSCSIPDRQFSAHADQNNRNLQTLPKYGISDIIPHVIWEGDSALDAWLSATSTEIGQVLLSLPSMFARLGLASGIALLVAYGLMGCWSCYVIVALYAQYRSIKEKQNIRFHNHTIQWHEILGGLLGKWWLVTSLVFNITYMAFIAAIQIIASGSIAFYINDKHSKRTWTLIFGAPFLLLASIPTARYYRIWSFMGILMTTYVGWYLTIASIIHGQDPGVKVDIRPHKMEEYFIGASTIVYLFSGSHGFTVEIMHNMWKPQEYKITYFYSTLYILSFAIPSASSVYWAFGDAMLENFNAFSLLPSSRFKVSAAIAMLMHEFIIFSTATLPINLISEKLIGLNHSSHFLKRWLARAPIVLLIWFLSIMVPFFGTINSVVGSILGTGVGYIIPCLAYTIYFWSQTNQENSIEKPPSWIGGWKGAFSINACVILWVTIIGIGFGVPYSIKSLLRQVHQFGLFDECYLCKQA